VKRDGARIGRFLLPWEFIWGDETGDKMVKELFKDVEFVLSADWRGEYQAVEYIVISSKFDPVTINYPAPTYAIEKLWEKYENEDGSSAARIVGLRFGAKNGRTL
jgi:hypothetical protein